MPLSRGATGPRSCTSPPCAPVNDVKAADAALFAALKSGLQPRVTVRELDCAVNDTDFATACAQALLDNLKQTQG